MNPKRLYTAWRRSERFPLLSFQGTRATRTERDRPRRRSWTSSPTVSKTSHKREMGWMRHPQRMHRPRLENRTGSKQRRGPIPCRHTGRCRTGNYVRQLRSMSPPTRRTRAISAIRIRSQMSLPSTSSRTLSSPTPISFDRVQVPLRYRLRHRRRPARSRFIGCLLGMRNRSSSPAWTRRSTRSGERLTLRRCRHRSGLGTRFPVSPSASRGKRNEPTFSS
jgi:hypothetical protein